MRGSSYCVNEPQKDKCCRLVWAKFIANCSLHNRLLHIRGQIQNYLFSQSGPVYKRFHFSRNGVFHCPCFHAIQGGNIRVHFFIWKIFVNQPLIAHNCKIIDGRSSRYLFSIWHNANGSVCNEHDCEHNQNRRNADGNVFMDDIFIKLAQCKDIQSGCGFALYGCRCCAQQSCKTTDR